MQLEELMTFKETGHKGDFLLPFIISNTRMPDFYTTFPMHWHDEIEIVYVDEGEFEETVSFSDYHVHQGDIIIIKPRAIHAFKQFENHKTRFRTMIFDLSIVTGNSTDACTIKYFKPFLEDGFDSPVIVSPGSDCYDKLKQILLSTFEVYTNKEKCYELEIKSRLYELFHLLFRDVFICDREETDISDSTSKNIKVILDYIRENYMNPITIEELAEKVNLSKHYFMRFFKKYMGMTCIEYINDYRLNIAANQLLTTRSQITDISVSIGITNLSYFNRIFKKKFNMTPKEYRHNSEIYHRQTKL